MDIDTCKEIINFYILNDKKLPLGLINRYNSHFSDYNTAEAAKQVRKYFDGLITITELVEKIKHEC